MYLENKKSSASLTFFGLAMLMAGLFILGSSSSIPGKFSDNGDISRQFHGQKTGLLDAENTPESKGYIVQFKEQPIIEKNRDLFQQLQTKESELKKAERANSLQSEIDQIKERLYAGILGQRAKLREEHSLARQEFSSRIPDFDNKILGEYEDTFNGMALDITQGEANVLKASAYVKNVYPNYEAKLFLADSIPQINADDVWMIKDLYDRNITGENVTISIIDTGVDYTRSDLGGCYGAGCKVAGGWDFANNDSDPMDDHGHGTHVAATAAGGGRGIPRYALKVTKIGSGSGKIINDTAGLGCGSNCIEYENGTVVTLAAVPGNGSDFTWWGGDCSGFDNCTLVMDSDKNVTANFSLLGPAHYNLSITRIGNVSGTSIQVNASGEISYCSSSCVFDYQDGTVLKLSPRTTSISNFTGWGGDCTGLGNCTLVMDGNKNVTANFTSINYSLSIRRAGFFGYTVYSEAGGQNKTCSSSCTPNFRIGAVVTVTAVPYSGSNFTGWTGDCTGLDKQCIITMDSDKSVTADFSYHLLQVFTSFASTGSGKVIGPGINCIGFSGDCIEYYLNGTTVTLTAVPDSGSVFGGWVGWCTGLGNCTVVMDSNKIVIALFYTTDKTLTVIRTGSGYGNVTGPSLKCVSRSCTKTYAHGTVITLSANPSKDFDDSYSIDHRSYFRGWGGDCNGSGNCTLVMDKHRTAIANFSLIPALGVSTSGSGLGTVMGSEIDCGTDCFRRYENGSIVTLEAVPFTNNYNFTGWSRSCSGTDNCTLVMDDDKNATANFELVSGNTPLKGVAPGASIYAYKVFKESGGAFFSDILAAIESSIDPNDDGDFSDRVDVISMSLGGFGSPDDPLSQASDNAVDAGSVVVVAAGNSGQSGYWSVGSPGTARDVITVGAIDRKDRIAYFSSLGPTSAGTTKPDIVAPGVLVCAARLTVFEPYYFSPIYSKCVDNNHVLLSGTSMATPHVSGVVTLIKQAHPDWSPQEIKNTIKGTAVDLGYDYLTQGAGRVDALKAVETSRPYPTAILDSTGYVFADGMVFINGTAEGPEFSNYTLEYGLGLNATEYAEISTSEEPVHEGLLGSLNVSDMPGEEITVRLSVYDRDSKKSVDNLLLIKRLSFWKKGWPREIDADLIYKFFPPVYGDLDNDGSIEIIVGSPGVFASAVYVFDSGGNLLPGWPQDVNILGGSAPALGDVDGDGDLEIVYKSAGLTLDLNNSANTIYVWKYDGTTLNSNWPKDISPEVISISSPSISDIDNDGKEEILVQTAGGIKVFKWDGSEIYGGWNSVGGGFPITTDNIAIGDLDKDGNREIVFASEYQLYAWHSNGSVIGGFPKAVEGNELLGNEPKIGDVDGDGYKDIVIAGKDRTDNCTIEVYNRTAKPLPGWPVILSCPNDYTAAVLADLDNDTRLEIVSMVGGGLYVFDYKGDVLVNVSHGLDYSVSPVIADIDGDNDMEIISAPGDSSDVYAWHHDGVPVEGWPRRLVNHSVFRHTEIVAATHGSAVGDIDNDGLNELITTLFFSQLLPDPSLVIGTHVFVIDLEGIGKNQWPMWMRDAQHTGLYTKPYMCGDVNGDGKVNLSDIIYLVNYIFKGGPKPVPFEAGDVNKDGKVNLSDIIYLVNYIFKGGPKPCA